MTKICKETGIPESTLRGWKKEEEKLRQFVSTVEELGLKRKRARLAQDPELE